MLGSVYRFPVLVNSILKGLYKLDKCKLKLVLLVLPLKEMLVAVSPVLKSDQSLTFLNTRAAGNVLITFCTATLNLSLNDPYNVKLVILLLL